VSRSFAFFLTVALSILGGMHLYFWIRLVRDPGLAEPWRRVATVLLVLLAVSFPVAMLALRRAPEPYARLVPAVGFSWLGVAFVLLVTLLAIDAVRLVAFVVDGLSTWLRGQGDPPADPARREFVARAVAGAAVVATAGASALALRRAGGPAELDEVPVRLERLPRALSGLTLAQITDLHIGPTIREREVRRVVEQTNGLRPDVIAITGDLVDGTVPELGDIVARLGGLSARHGVFFVTGNHDHYSGAGPWVAYLRKLGIRVLRNERVSIGDAGASIDLAGVDDYGHGLDLDRALAGRDPDRALVLLAHQPRGIQAAVEAGVDLQLSGHTHGGQIVPFNLVVGAIQPYVRGLHRHVQGDRAGQIYVSRGTGYWGPPMRLGSPPEIAHIVLTPG
jgi:predicted MPP superfamily phosphohydrolase